jgi:hypothetical protein
LIAANNCLSLWMPRFKASISKVYWFFSGKHEVPRVKLVASFRPFGKVPPGQKRTGNYYDKGSD